MEQELALLGPLEPRVQRLHIRENWRVRRPRILEVQRPLDRWEVRILNRHATGHQTRGGVRPRRHVFRTRVVQLLRHARHLPRLLDLCKRSSTVGERERGLGVQFCLALGPAREVGRLSRLTRRHTRELRLRPGVSLSKLSFVRRHRHCLGGHDDCGKDARVKGNHCCCRHTWVVVAGPWSIGQDTLREHPVPGLRGRVRYEQAHLAIVLINPQRSIQMRSPAYSADLFPPARPLEAWLAARRALPSRPCGRGA